MDERTVGVWYRQRQALVDAIRAQGMARYVAGIPDLARWFLPADRWLRCIDEGTPGGVHLAGSGILLGVEEAANIARAAGVTAVTSHEECGAAKLWATQQGKEVRCSDDHGKQFAAEVAKRLGVSYCHLPIAEMSRPAGLHVARVIYYDGTGKFDPSHVPQLPPGFVISRRYVTAKYASQECAIALSIALGDHGLGTLFTPHDPLLLVAIGHPSDAPLSQQHLRSEVTSVAESHGGRVIVDGFTAPSLAHNGRS